MTDVLRYAAFDVDGEGGNPAGVVLDAHELSAAQMQRIAADVGYSETAFLIPRAESGPSRFDIRYYSPHGEVAFCGHATIATAVALAERRSNDGYPNDDGYQLTLRTAAGEVAVTTFTQHRRAYATLTSVQPSVRGVAEPDLAAALRALRWQADELDTGMPPRIANAGNDHLVLAADSRERLAELSYDQHALGELMVRLGWTTVHLVWRRSSAEFHARDPFPPGGVYEDPATGAAAAAFGAYLRTLDLLTLPARITIHQGEDMGRPSQLLVDIPPGPTTGISVSGSAAPITA